MLISNRRARHECRRAFQPSSGEIIELKSRNEGVFKRIAGDRREIRLALNFTGRSLVSSAGIISNV